LQIGDAGSKMADRTHVICPTGFQERPIGRRARRAIEEKDPGRSAGGDRCRQRDQIVLWHVSEEKHVGVRRFSVFVAFAFSDRECDSRLGHMPQRQAEDDDEE
jgi:hypothetical protein